MPIVPKPRRGLRVTLAAFMALVLALGAWLGWVANRAKVQRDTVAAIRRLYPEAYIRYDWQVTAKGQPPRTPWGPKWLREALGPDAFDTVTLVEIAGPKLDDAMMDVVARLDRLESFRSQARPSKGLTTAGMLQARNLRRLRSIDLSFPESRGFFQALDGMANLRKVKLGQACVKDEDMAILRTLPALEELEIDGRELTEKGFARLSDARSLTTLGLYNSGMVDLAPLGGLVNLKKLSVIAHLPPRFDDSANPPVRSSLAPLRSLTRMESLILDLSLGDDDLAVVAGFSALVEIKAYGRAITDAGLAHLSALPKLSWIILGDTSIHDLSPLGPALLRLTMVALNGSQVGDDGLAALRSSAKLLHLVLKRTLVTDASLRPIGGMKSLAALSLDRTAITDEGLREIAGLTSLSNLTLVGTAITDEGLRHISGLVNINMLLLDETRVTDAGLAHLAGMTRLRQLYLTDTAVSDAGLMHLAKLPKLQVLVVTGAKTTKAGRDQLKKARPGMMISDVTRIPRK